MQVDHGALGRRGGHAEAAQPHAAAVALDPALLRHHAVGKGLHLGNGTLQHAHLEAVLVVHVDVQRRDRQVVVVVLGRGQAPGEIARLVLIGVGQRRDAGRIARSRRLLPGCGLPDEIADCLRPAAIAAPLRERVHDGEKVVVDGDGEGGHGLFRGFALASRSRAICRSIRASHAAR